jgi:hypothetical protein
MHQLTWMLTSMLQAAASAIAHFRPLVLFQEEFTKRYTSLINGILVRLHVPSSVHAVHVHAVLSTSS